MMKFLIRFAASACLVIASGGFLATTASAVSINIQNHSFESPVTQSFGEIPSGWTRTQSISGGAIDAGVFRPSTKPPSGTDFINGVDGEQTAFSNEGDFSQELNDVLQIGTYTLTVAIGDRADGILKDHTINFLAGGSIIASASNAVVPVNLAGGWVDLVATIVVLSGDSLLGSVLGIELLNDGLIPGIAAVQVNFDNVRLDFQAASVVPVPAALPLFGTGLAIMGFVGWRRKRKAIAA